MQRERESWKTLIIHSCILFKIFMQRIFSFWQVNVIYQRFGPFIMHIIIFSNCPTLLAVLDRL